jgi:predicted lipoprotein with Yx(FWY)xxD motif
MIHWLLAPVVLVAVLIWGISPTVAQTTIATVTVAQSDQYGTYLADAEGRALYLFTADLQGSGEAKAVSNCYDACAEAWPPLSADNEPQAGEQVDAALLGTIERNDGSKQVTYNGWPLYYFVKDQGAGEITGQDKHGFGGEWYLVTPQGAKVEEEH